MKKLLIGILIGIILHMLYLDLVVIKQHRGFDQCIDNVIVSHLGPQGADKCLEELNSGASSFYGKYFGLYRLMPYKWLSLGTWRME